MNLFLHTFTLRVGIRVPKSKMMIIHPSGQKTEEVRVKKRNEWLRDVEYNKKVKNIVNNAI